MKNLSANIVQDALDVADCPLVITDAKQVDNPIIYVNEAYLKLSGYKKSEILGKNPRFMHGDNTEQNGLTDLKQAIAEARTCTTKVRNLRKDRSIYLCSVTIKPIFAKDTGELTHWVGVQRDISAESTLEIWSAVLAHDLKNPLIGMKVMLKAFLEGGLGPLTSEQREYLAKVTEENQRLLSSLKDMLTLYRSREFNVEAVSRQKISLIEIITQVTQTLDDCSSIKNSVLVETNTSETFVHANTSLLFHAMFNLIDNSIRYSSNKTCLVNIDADSAINTAFIEITNQISKPLPQSPFASPFELPASTDAWSTRLGLYLARHIIETINGKIQFMTNDRNAKFLVSLPLAIN